MTRGIDIAAVKSRASLVALLERDGIKPRRNGDHFVVLCPFHREKTPSCHVWDDHLHCFGCNTHVDVIDYVRKTRSLTFPEALEALGGAEMPSANTTHVRCHKEATPSATPRDFHSVWCDLWKQTEEEKVVAHAKRIGVDSECLWWLGIVWSEDQKAWGFPMRNGSGGIVGMRLRKEDGSKFAITGSKQGLFIPTKLIVDDRIFICEGPTDSAACLTLGFYAIGRPSCNGAVNHVLDFLRNNRCVREIVLVTDNDGPGIKGADELRRELPVRSYQLLLPPKDIRRFVQMGGAKALIVSMLKAQMAMAPTQRT